MTSISVISSRKPISRHQEDSVQFTAQQSQFPTYRPDGPEEAFGHPSVFKDCPNTSADTKHREIIFALMSGQPNE
jgi:hypothetical protein